MGDSLSPLLAAIQIYPVKGLSPASLSEAECVANHGLKGDRRYALHYASSAPVRDAVDWREKSFFLEQNDWPGLAAFDTRLETDLHLFVVEKGGKTLLSADVRTNEGLRRIDRFFSETLTTLRPMKSALPHQVPPVWWVGSLKSRYPDRINQNVSLLSRASLRDLESALKTTIEMDRFRGNLILDDLPEWQEETWAGKTLIMDDVLLHVTKPIGRCNNINVHPRTGEVDLPLLTDLARYRKKANFGMLAHVIKGGFIRVNSRIRF